MSTTRRGVRDAWNQNADFWDRVMGEGNAWQRTVIGPSVERLLEPREGLRVLDLACGSGHVSRRLAELGCYVTAADFADRFLEHARRRLQPYAERASTIELDITDHDALDVFASKHRFDVVLCNMALMDIAEIEPMAGVMRRLLEPKGCFILSVLHPSFHNEGSRLCVEEEDRDGAIVHEWSVRIHRYATPQTVRGSGMEGQPAPQVYFHRPLNVLLRPFFAAGLVLDALDEPTFPDDSSAERLFSWTNLRDVPPVLVCRLRP